jgi:hypothetical protein
MLKILAKALMLKSDIAEEGWELPGNYSLNHKALYS